MNPKKKKRENWDKKIEELISLGEDWPTKRTYIISDLCMWEKNKREGTMSDHCIGVIDEKTGQSRFIKTGSRIKFVSGEISPTLNQKSYNTPLRA